MRRLIALVATVSIGLAPSAAAQVDDTPGEQLGGYDAAASALAVSFQPFLPALVSTGDVPFEASLALSSARVKSGGNAFGRAALLWPGATAADMGPILGVAFGQPEIGALIPKWPVQAEATQRDGEVTAGAPPVAAMRAVGQRDRAEGDGRVADVHIPRVVHIEHIASTSRSIVLDGSVTSEAIVKLQGVSLLGGFIKAEEIRSVSRTTSLGSAASSSGDVDIVGLRIGGVEVSVTDEGFAATGLPPDATAFPGGDGEPAPGASPEEFVNAVLDALGARITLFESISSVRGGVAERMQPGVVISVDNPVGGSGPIPPGRFDIILASSSASALATEPFTGGLVPPGNGGTAGIPGGGGTQSGGGGSISIGGGSVVGGQTVPNTTGGLTDAAAGPLGALPDAGAFRPAGYRFDGLPLGLVVALLLAALLAARAIRRALFGFVLSKEEGSV